ncbi:hypothetical protein AMTR_s00021p00049000 [Amborella trichopoda]|uniref:Uncharacterized protein n=1 Tax=Amborella trichopoda TaxID=13333 RepID=W1Q0Y4_AMBTC|nr:hypothetical protein AMTR_s00021p00049000 [Amborella trichopoda]
MRRENTWRARACLVREMECSEGERRWSAERTRGDGAHREPSRRGSDCLAREMERSEGERRWSAERARGDGAQKEPLRRESAWGERRRLFPESARVEKTSAGPSEKEYFIFSNR